MDAAPTPLADLLRLWQVDPNGHRELLLDAARTHVATADTVPAVEALATGGEDASRSGFARLVATCLEALGQEPLTGIDLQDSAVAAQARRQLAGAITPRELTYWVTSAVGLRGSARSQPFLTLEQEYCDRLADPDVSDLDDRVRVAAQTFLAGADESETAGGLRQLFAKVLRRT
jgi:hypothetical protein